MRIGVAAETKPGERRVALVPRDVLSLSTDGQQLSIQSGAGSGTGYSDDDYRDAGARVVDADQVWQNDLVVKVKELQDVDFAHVVPGQAVFGYHHLTGHPAHARRLLASGITAIAYEAVRDASGGFPLLAPMSVIAGRMAVRVAARALGRVPRDVLVLGAGHAGNSAADAARAAGARVTQLRRATATAEAVERSALQADLVVGAAFTAGERTPKLLPRPLVARMKRGSMIVDISIEEGGVAETSRATSHVDPTYVEEGVIHYAVPNMPSAVPREAAEAISAAVMPYARALASKGIALALLQDAGLRAGVLAWRGRCNQQGLAREAGVPYAPVSDLELRALNQVSADGRPGASGCGG
ncbi:MAG TPA: alanine dehydrogenase [Casimicrobiaceae bacterium]|nr:alanine dehydrogenase [Casimicrobiaceae bacterium]